MKKSKKNEVINYLVSYWYRGVHPGIENKFVKASSKQEAYDIFGKLSSGTVIAITPMDD
jgi:hypothetical protein